MTRNVRGNRWLLALAVVVVLAATLALLVGLPEPALGVQNADLTLSNSTTPSENTDHAWSIQLNSSAPDRQLDAIELDYSGTGVGINSTNLTATSVTVYIGGTFTEVSSVSTSSGVVNVTLFNTQTVTGGQSITITTNSTDPAFTNPSTVGNYQAEIRLTGDSFEPQSAPFTVGTGFSGVVTDDTGTALEGVNITVLETGNSTTTDTSGNFSLAVPAGTNYTLRFQKAGYVRTDYINLSLSQNQVIPIDQEMIGRTIIGDFSVSDRTPNATGVTYGANFTVNNSVTNVSYVSFNLTDAATAGLSTDGVSSNNLTFMVNGTEVSSTLVSTPGDPEVILNLSSEQDFSGTEQLKVSVGNVTNPDTGTYGFRLGLHEDQGGSPSFAKTLAGTGFDIGIAGSRVRNLTIPDSERTILSDTPKHTNTFDTSASNIQSLASGPATQTLNVTLDADGTASEEQLVFDLNDTYNNGLNVSLLQVTAPASEISISSATIDESNQTLLVNYSASSDVTNATISVDIELSTSDGVVPVGVATHIVTGPSGYGAGAPYRVERDGATGVAYGDASAQTFLGQTTTINATRNGTGGAFRIWQNQTLTFQQALVDQNVTIYTATQDGSGAWQLGSEVQQLNTYPGALSGYRAMLPAGEYFVTFEGASDAAYLQVEPLNLNASVTPSTAAANEEVTLNVSSADPGGNVAVAIVDQNDQVVYDQQVTLDQSGNATLSFVPDTDLAGTGQYYAVLYHNESELSTYDQFLVESGINGSVTIDSPVSANQSSITVNYEFGDTSNGDAYLVVENLDTGGVVTHTVTANGSKQINITDFEGIQAGDTIGATLWDSTSQTTQLAGDSVVVEAAGSPYFEVGITQAPATVEAGSTVSVDTEVTNTGDTAGTQTIDFSVRNDAGEIIYQNTKEVSLDAGATTTVSFSFVPDSADDVTVKVASEDSQDSTTITVQSGGTPSISVSSSDISFGEVPVGESKTADVTITNEGDAPLDLERVSIAEGEDWYSANVNAGSLESGESTTVTVTFRPDATETLTGGLVIRSNDPQTQTVTVGLSGTGVEGEISLSADGVPFGDVSVDETATESLTLTNDGDAPVRIRELSIDGANASVFSADIRKQRIEGGASTTIQVSFTPSSVDSFEGTLVLKTRGGQTVRLPLSGNGAEKQLGIGQETLEFGDVSVEDNETRSITISNPTDSTINVGGVEISDGDASVFSVELESSTIGPGESTTAQITFTPSERDDYSATISIFGPDGNLQGSVSLTGTGVAGELRVTPTSIQFDEVTANDSVTETVTIENIGEAEVTVESIRLTGDSVFEIDIQSDRIRLGPGTSRTFTVTFTPEEQESFSGHIRIESDAAVSGTVHVSLNSGKVRSEATQTGQNQTTTNIRIENATAGEEVTASVAAGSEEEDFEVQNLSMTPTQDGDLEVNITAGTASLESTPDAGFPSDNTTQLGNISVEANVDNENIEEVSFTYRVSVEELNARGTDPEDVALYRYNESLDRWVEHETKLIGIENGEAILQTTGDGFSDWTAAAKRPELGITDTAIDIQAATTEEEVTIQVFVTNTGGTEGTFEAQLITNGEIIDREDSPVQPNETVVINFVRTFEQPDVYEVQVNNVPVGEVEITEDEEVVVSTPEPSEDPTNGDGTGEGEDGGEDDGQTSDGGGGPLDGLGPGFGVPVAILALVVASYLAVRRRQDEH